VSDPCSTRLASLLTTLRKQFPDACAELAAASAACGHGQAERNPPTPGASGVNGSATPDAPAEAPKSPGEGTPPAASAQRRGFVDEREHILCEFIRSFLLWEATGARAAAAIRRLEQGLVDFNELRVCMPDELARLLGKTYPRCEERCLRLRTALNAIYAREHRVTLEHLARMSKRETKEYLESIEGVPRFVSARVQLLALSGHAAPIDGRIHRRLIDAEVVGADSTPDEAAGQLEKRVRAGEMLETYALLQAFADQTPEPSPDRREGKGAKGKAGAAKHRAPRDAGEARAKTRRKS
jgi:hypothetical protein